MTYKATVLKVMIASPGDVKEERMLSRQVVYEWNAVHSEDRETVLLPIAWETNASPAMGARAQEIINKQILRDSDLLIAIFWTRLGTPTGMANSGTAEEIEEHLRVGKPAMLYFSTSPVKPDSVDERQYRALREFRDSMRDRGLVEEYESLNEFREKLTRHLAQTVIRNFPTIRGAISREHEQSREPDVTPHDAPRERSLSKEALQLLGQATIDPNGTILIVTTFGGLSVETNGKNFAESGNARSEANWRAAVQELVADGYIEQRDQNGQVFSVTNVGYKLEGADRYSSAQIAIERLSRFKENLPRGDVEERFVNAYNEILSEEQDRTGVDLSNFLVPSSELKLRRGITSFDEWGEVNETSWNGPYCDRNFLTMKIDDAMIALRAAADNQR
jgi:hypothetical protein